MFTAPLILLVVLFAIADRFAGGGFGWNQLAHDHGGPLRGRPIYYSALAMMIASVAIMHHASALGFGMAFLLWRLPGWDIGLHDGLTPKTGEDFVFAIIRHLLALIVVPFAMLMGHDWKIAAQAATAFAVIAAMLGMVNGSFAKKGKDINYMIETARGAVFGLMVVLIVNDYSLLA